MEELSEQVEHDAVSMRSSMISSNLQVEALAVRCIKLLEAWFRGYHGLAVGTRTDDNIISPEEQHCNRCFLQPQHQLLVGTPYG